MDTPTERINKWIEEEGRGDTRDALNVALCRLEAAQAEAKQADEDWDTLLYACSETKKRLEAEIKRLKSLWDPENIAERWKT